jgi:hypothetical protein
MPKVADQVCDGMIVPRAAFPLKNRDRLCGPGDVLGFIDHALPQRHNQSMPNSRCQVLSDLAAQRAEFRLRRHHPLSQSPECCPPCAGIVVSLAPDFADHGVIRHHVAKPKTVSPST